MRDSAFVELKLKRLALDFVEDHLSVCFRLVDRRSDVFFADYPEYEQLVEYARGAFVFDLLVDRPFDVDRWWVFRSYGWIGRSNRIECWISRYV